VPARQLMDGSIRRIEIPSEADAHEWLESGDGALAEAVTVTQQAADGAAWIFRLDQDNAHRVESLYRLCRDLGAELRLSLSPKSDPDAGTRAFLEDFVRRLLIQDPSRSTKQCEEDRALLLQIAAAGEAGPDRRIVMLSRVLRLGFRALVRDVFHQRHSVPEEPESMENPLLIGAYGGEHVGDAAILGGVLLDLNKKYGTQRAMLGSFRPAHSERLVRSLDVPVEVEVFDYEHGHAESQLRIADALVFAGGPLMDLPNLLVKHWYLAIEARRRGLPFMMDRIGVGPFARGYSRFVARRIARLASSISVRTSGATRQPELRGLAATIGSDPAFTYLESRGNRGDGLSMLRARDRRDVESLLQGAECKLKVGINLRPIRHLWCPKGESASRDAELQCLERVADAIVLTASKYPARFIFFPMNPIQLGESDLQSAWQLHKLVGRRADIRVWQGDPGVDGLLFLLRHLDVAVTMRFHACIFALSQAIPTLGIDYYAYAGGKVEELFKDRGLTADVARIDNLETAWLVEKLEAVAHSAGYRAD